jgi:predicted RNase H-like nuclease (RuvC/YqgF family)
MARFIALSLLSLAYLSQGAPVNPETKQVAYKNPIQRVVALLKQMKAELDAEAANEAEMYDKMVCWCQTNEKEKTKAIADAEAKDKELSAEIEARSAGFGKLSTQIAALKKQIAKDTEAAKEAMAMREKMAADFRDEEKDLVQTITNLKNAIRVLSRHQGGGSLLQLDAPIRSSMLSLLQDTAMKYDLLRGDSLEGRNTHGSSQASFVSVSNRDLGRDLRSVLSTEFAGSSEIPLKYAQRVLERADPSAQSAAFLQSSKPADFKSYSAHSDQIFGIILDMQER